MYRAFVDNYEVAMETAEKCCQANAQFAEISEVRMMLFREVCPSTSLGGAGGVERRGRSWACRDPREHALHTEVWS